MRNKKKDDYILTKGSFFSKKFSCYTLIVAFMFILVTGCNDKTVSISKDWEVKIEKVETRDSFKEGPSSSSLATGIPKGVFKVIRVELTSHISGAVAVQMKDLVLVDVNGVEYPYSADGQTAYDKETGMSTDSWYTINQNQARVFEIVYDVPEHLEHLKFVTTGSLPYAVVEIE